MPDRIADLAHEVLKAHGLWRLPVDPRAIAQAEGIVIAAGVYGPSFDARIEYFASESGFGIFHNGEGPGRPHGRVRFSLAHELGHFYIPEHRAALRAGVTSNCIANFHSHTERERQADTFASELLMPGPLFVSAVRRFRQSVCDLKDLCALATRLETSLTSTILRYCNSDIEACTAVFTDADGIAWAVASYDMRSRGMSYVEFGAAVPDDTVTAEVWRRIAAGESLAITGRRTEAHRWFERPRGSWVWEEVMPLGATGRVVTLLTPDDG